MPSQFQAYRYQKNVARQRGILWELSFEDWRAWWQAQLGPDWFRLRGRKAGQYCMSRYGDIGAYNLQNIRCILHVDNSKEAAPRMLKTFRAEHGSKIFHKSPRERGWNLKSEFRRAGGD